MLRGALRSSLIAKVGCSGRSGASGSRSSPLLSASLSGVTTPLSVARNCFRLRADGLVAAQPLFSHAAQWPGGPDLMLWTRAVRSGGGGGEAPVALAPSASRSSDSGFENIIFKFLHVIEMWSLAAGARRHVNRRLPAA